MESGNFTQCCPECEQMILDELETEIKQAEWVRDSYLKYLQDVEFDDREEEENHMQEVIKQVFFSNCP